MAEFFKAIGGVLEREGGYVKDPADHGGETKYGISKRSYPDMDIQALTKQDATDIYGEDFWRPICADQIVSQSVANVLFDFAVNTGKTRAVKLLQQLVRVSADGMVGPITLDAVNDFDGEFLAMQYTLHRIQFYNGLAERRKSQRKFLSGWINRAMKALYE
jgi:lysozyme family protein